MRMQRDLEVIPSGAGLSAESKRALAASPVEAERKREE